MYIAAKEILFFFSKTNKKFFVAKSLEKRRVFLNARRRSKKFSDFQRITLVFHVGLFLLARLGAKQPIFPGMAALFALYVSTALPFVCGLCISFQC